MAALSVARAAVLQKEAVAGGCIRGDFELALDTKAIVSICATSTACRLDANAVPG